MGTILKMAENGHLKLPVDMLRLVGLERGGPVSVSVENGEIRVRTVRDVMESLQDDAQRVFGGSDETVDGFLSDRRAE